MVIGGEAFKQLHVFVVAISCCSAMHRCTFPSHRAIKFLTIGGSCMANELLPSYAHG